MKFAKLPALALLAGALILPLLASCARQPRQPVSTEPGAVPDTSVNSPEPRQIVPPEPLLIAFDDIPAPAAPAASATASVSAPALPPSPVPYLRTYHALAREAMTGGIEREAAAQLRNAAELMDQVIVTAPRYTPSQPWLVDARDELHALADQANRGELESSAALERGFARAFRATQRFQADLARPATQPANEPPPPWVIP